MHVYINGVKTKYNEASVESRVESSESVEAYTDTDTNTSGKCPTWVFIILGIIAGGIAVWLIYCILHDRKRRN